MNSRLLIAPFLLLLAGGVSAQWTNPHPEEAKVHYPQGEAPFFVRARLYARHLESLFGRGMQQSRQREADALGVDVAQLQAIHVAFSDYWGREEQVRRAAWDQDCAPLLRGEAVTDEQARAIFVRHDDNAWRDAFAEEILDDVAAELGVAIADRVREHVIEQGEPIEFTDDDFARVIEIGRGGLFLSHMMIECGTHPDFPRR